MAAMTGNAIREALEPFAKIAEHDIGADEADTDFFRPMVRYNRAPRLTVGDLRRARTAYDAIGAGVKALDGNDVWEMLFGVIHDRAHDISEAECAKIASLLSTHTAAGAGPVGEAVAPLGYLKPENDYTLEPRFIYAKDRTEDWMSSVFTEPVYARPVEEPGEVASVWKVEQLAEQICLGGYPEDMRRELEERKNPTYWLGLPEKTREQHRRSARTVMALYARPADEPGEVERLTRERDAARRDYAELDKATEAEIERWRENSRANWEAFSAMRNDINELVGNMAKLERQKRLLLEASSDAGKWEDRCRTAEGALAETQKRLEKVEAAARPFVDLASPRHLNEGGSPSLIDIMTDDGEQDEIELRGMTSTSARTEMLHGYDFRDLLAALTGDAQEGGK